MSRPSQMRLHAFSTGTITLPLGSFLPGSKGKITVPVPCYLIDHPRGRAMIDTGIHPEIAGGSVARLGEVARYFTIDITPAEVVDAQIARIGFGPADVDLIINTHLHYDHCGGNICLPDARVIVQRREWQAANDPLEIAANNYNPDDYAHCADHLQLVDGEHDVFGDGSVVCLPTYGHTPGHQSVRIVRAGRRILLCGDACYLRENLERLTPSMVCSNKEAARAALRRLVEYREQGMELIYGHDPVQWEALRTAPGMFV